MTLNDVSKVKHGRNSAWVNFFTKHSLLLLILDCLWNEVYSLSFFFPPFSLPSLPPSFLPFFLPSFLSFLPPALPSFVSTIPITCIDRITYTEPSRVLSDLLFNWCPCVNRFHPPPTTNRNQNSSILHVFYQIWKPLGHYLFKHFFYDILEENVLSESSYTYVMPTMLSDISLILCSPPPPLPPSV